MKFQFSLQIGTTLSASSKRQIRRERKVKRYKQKRLNIKLKKKLFGHLFMAPCCYCLRAFLVETLTIEHITPLCLGGTNDPSNIALACEPCNNDRGRDAWFQRRQINKKYYEQYHTQHRNENRERIVQEISTSFVHGQGDGV